MRIGLYLSSRPSDGGVYQYNITMLEAVKAFSPERFETIVIFTDSLWQERLQEFNGDKVYLPVSPYVRLLRRVTRERLLSVTTLRRWSSLIHPTIRFLQHQRCGLWLFPSQDPVSYHGELPSLVAVHDLMHRYERRFPEVSAHGLYEWREMHYRSICRYAQGILVDSEKGKRQLHESYDVDFDKIHVLPFVAPRYVFDSVPSKDFANRYVLPKRFIFYPAQFWEHKNHENLIRAVHFLRDDIQDLHLVLVGGRKNGYHAARALVEQLQLAERVHFVGFVPDHDIPEFYKRAVATVIPSFFGPTNILPLEAFAAGCPCAVSNVYGIPEQVGDAALLFDPHDPGEIAASIRALWYDEDLRLRLIARGREKTAVWNQRHFTKRLEEIVGAILLG